MELNPVPRSDAPVARIVQPPAGVFFVGYLGGVPAGGHARTILARLETAAAVAGHDVMVLSTGSLQPEAIQLYLSAGYEPVEPFGHYANAPLVRCFAKRLAIRPAAG